MATATTTKVLDRTRFEARARLIDIVAFGLLLVAGAALVFQMYTLGYSAAEIQNSVGGADPIVVHDQAAVRIAIASFIAALGVGWVGYRLFSGSARRVGG